MKKTATIISLIISIILILGMAGMSFASGTLTDPSDDSQISEKYTVGQYKVGVDIPAGEYFLFAVNGTGYFCVSSDSNQDDIIQNDNFDYNSIITVQDGTYFELVRCEAIPLNEVSNNDIDVSGSGFFKIGLHIPSGEYKLEADAGETGYYCIYNDSTQEEIVSNNNFETSQYVTVNDGQYLELVRCKITPTPQKLEKTYNDPETIKRVQEFLNSAGYDCGTPDGSAGPNTQAAIIQYKQDKNLGNTADITQSLIDSLTSSTSENTATKDSSSIDTSKAYRSVTDFVWNYNYAAMVTASVYGRDLGEVTVDDVMSGEFYINPWVSVVSKVTNNGDIKMLSIAAKDAEIAKNETNFMVYMNIVQAFITAMSDDLDFAYEHRDDFAEIDYDAGMTSTEFSDGVYNYEFFPYPGLMMLRISLPE